MKVVVVGFLILCVLLLVVAISHEEDRRHQQADEAIRNLQAESARYTAETDARILELRAHLAEMRYGEGALYRLCHQYPPTTKEHQAKCKALDDRMARDDAKDAKHPW